MKANIPVQRDQGFEMTPMIDVVFLLIVFFMVVASEIVDLVPVEIPEADRARVPEELGVRQTVSITLDGDVFVDLRQVTIDELGARVRQGIENEPGYRVYIRADAGTRHEHVREVMQACADNGVFDIIFATFQSDG